MFYGEPFNRKLAACSVAWFIIVVLVIIYACSGCVSSEEGVLLPTPPGLAKAMGNDHTWEWSYPTTGSYADSFRVRLTGPGIDTTYFTVDDSLITVTIMDLRPPYDIVVAGVDAAMRQGPWSLPGHWPGLNPGTKHPNVEDQP